jgi:hypothetical protein
MEFVGNSCSLLANVRRKRNPDRSIKEKQTELRPTGFNSPIKRIQFAVSKLLCCPTNYTEYGV